MKVALVNYDTFQGRSTGLYPPLHLCILATSIEDAGHEARVFDFAGSFAEIGDYFKEVAAFAPHVIGLTSYTPYIKSFHRLTRELRRAVPDGTLMVVGGPHPTVWPQWTLEKMPQFDYAVCGEADRAMGRLVQMLDGKASAESVPGLVAREDGRIRVNPRDEIVALDSLPQVRRSFLDRYYKRQMYWDMAARAPLDMMITSRGCPYSCTFCFKVEKKWRFRGAEHVLAEFEELARRGVRSVHVQDDAFTANRKRCLEICRGLISARFRFELKVRSRVNNVDADLLAVMKKAGVRQIIYGIESGSQKILDVMNKKATVEMNRKTIELTKKAGIACYADIMLGMPGEDRDTIDETIAFLLSTKPIVGYIPVLYPLPGTRVYEEAKAQGALVGDWDVESDWPWVKLPWASSSDDIYRESRRVSRTIQTDLGTVLYFLRHHLRTMGRKQMQFLWQHARTHLLHGAN